MVDLERHEQIRKALRARGVTLTALAASLAPPCSGSAVTRISQGYNRSARIESAIAAALDTTPAALWPDRYPAPDEPWAREAA